MIHAVMDGREIPWRRWGRTIPRGSPARRAAACKLLDHRRARSWRIRASGILVGVVNMGFNPKLVLYVAANTTSTETIPSGSTRVVNEAWGAGGNGATPLGAGQRGGGGGGGGYSLSTFACAANYGQTLIVRVTNTAAAEQTSPATLVSSGSFAISTITAGCGTGGTTGPNGGGGGTGGPVTNANAGALNTNGNNGTAGDVGISGAGGAARAGQVTGDGGPYGAGGATAASATLGAVVFYYT